MIFVTVGTQLPFDRLVRAVDEWVAANSAIEAFAQIGAGTYRPRHMAWEHRLAAADFREKLRAVRLVVSHAGVGSLLLALEAQKPMLIMPRRAALQEHRDDHQLATAKWLQGRPGITVVEDAAALHAALDDGGWREPPPLRDTASPELLAAIRDFINRS